MAKAGENFATHDPASAPRPALQVHSGGPVEVRWKDFEIDIDPEPEMKTVK